MFNKEQYWKNRKDGKRGQENLNPKTTVFKTPDDIQIGFDNDGKMIAKTRALRRHKNPTLNIYTKATHAIKKARSKK